MSPSDMPDFDNMSPDEMMRWMESLAKRQGANAEELLTSADADIAEVDPDTVVDEPGYVPFGEENKKPAAKKPDKPAAAKPPPPPPPPAPEPPPPPPPAPEPAPAAPAGDGTPDFDNMSPDEMMRWMESLAKRQGANAEELLTSADADIAEVDPDTVIDEPGYVPFGEENKKPAAKKPEPAAKKPAPEPEPPPAAPEPMGDFFSQFTDPQPAASSAGGDDTDDWLSSLTGDSGAAGGLPGLDDLDALTADLGGLDDLGDLDSMLGDTQPAPANSMAWLDSLSSSQPEPPAAESAPQSVANPLESGDDPLKWLESLAAQQGANPEELITGGGMDIPQPEAGAVDASPGYDAYNVDNEGTSQAAASLENVAEPEDWLNQLTQAENTESDPADWLSDLAGGDSVDAFGAITEESVLDASDPRSWLGDQADAQSIKFDPNPPQAGTKSTGDPIADKINAGITPSPEEMKEWMGRQMSHMLSAEPLPIEEDEEPIVMPDSDAPAVQGEMPDWLQGMAPADDAPAQQTDLSALGIDAPDMTMFTDEADTGSAGVPDFLDMVGSGEPQGEPSPLSEQISAPDANDIPDMPDWLKSDMPFGGDTLEDIFETTEEPQVPEATPQTAPLDKLDPELLARLDPTRNQDDDPWVEALAMEDENEDTLESWYDQSINDPERAARVDKLVGPVLEEAGLPDENQLARGQREPLPDWLMYATGEAEPPAVAAAPTFVSEPEPSNDAMPDWLVTSDDAGAAGGDMPDWLMDSGTAAAQDVPDWLLETLPEEAQQTVAPAPPPQPAAPVQPPPQPAQPVVPAQTAPPQPAASPVPVPAQAQIDVGAALTAAQSLAQSGNVDQALMEYEKVVRANAQLETVTASVAAIIKADKNNPAAYRVLGDALMRQGRLQEALDTYRRALNLL